MPADRIEVNQGDLGSGEWEVGSGKLRFTGLPRILLTIKQSPIKHTKHDGIFRQAQIVSRRHYSYTVSHSPLPTPHSPTRNHLPVHCHARRLLAAVDADAARPRA